MLSKRALIGWVACVAIGLAGFLAFRQWRLGWGTGDSAFNAPKQLAMTCGACGHTFAQRGAEYVDRLRANAAEYLLACPHCKQKAARPATQCPSCHKNYLGLGHDGRGTAVCPHCQTAGSQREVPGGETLALPAPR